jgi:hypothetical protein
LELILLSDELNAVTPSKGSFELRAMPFAGDFGRAMKAHPPYPLTGLRRLSPMERRPWCTGARKPKRSRVSSPRAPYVNADPLLVDQLTSRVTVLVERVPLRILSFAKDTRSWSVLDHEYRSPHTAVSF